MKQGFPLTPSAIILILAILPAKAGCGAGVPPEPVVDRGHGSSFISSEDVTLLRNFLDNHYPGRYARIYLGRISKVPPASGALAWTAFEPLDHQIARRRCVRILHSGSTDISASMKHRRSGPWFTMEGAVSRENRWYVRYGYRVYYFELDDPAHFALVKGMLDALQAGRVKTRAELAPPGTVFDSTDKQEFRLERPFAVRIPDVPGDNGYEEYSNPRAVRMEVSVPGNPMQGEFWILDLDLRKRTIVLLEQFGWT